NCRALKVSIHNTITAIEKADWDAHHPGIFTLNYDFLKALEFSNSGDVEYRYLMISECGSPVGITVLTSFTLNLGLLQNDSSWLSFLMRFWPDLLNVRIACCGIPASFSQSPFYFNPGTDTLKTISEISFILDQFASETNSDVIIWKEFSAKIPFLLSLGYHEYPSIPDCHVDCDISSFNEFLQRIRSNYRRKFYTQDILNHSNVQISEAEFSKEHVENFYQGYLQVLERSTQKLETYSIDFFYQLASLPELRIRKLTIRHENESISALIAKDHQALNFLLVSKVNTRYELPLYNWMLQKMVRLGVSSKKSIVKLGQTSYYSKQAVGARLVDLHFYIKHTNKLKDHLLQSVGSWLFPKPVITPLNTSTSVVRNDLQSTLSDTDKNHGNY
ncbi:MAG: hypothetical protein P8X57_07905, partial [Cyclobacteriaceae bacterium]